MTTETMTAMDLDLYREVGDKVVRFLSQFPGIDPEDELLGEITGLIHDQIIEQRSVAA